MKVYQITENQIDEILPLGNTNLVVGLGNTVAKALSAVDIAPGPNKFNYTKASGGDWLIKDPKGNPVGTVNSKAAAASTSIKLNRSFLTHGLDSDQFKSAFKQAQARTGLKLNTNFDPKKVNVDGSKSLGKAAVGTAKGIGKSILATMKGTLVGNVVFGFMAVEDIADDLDAWAKVYMENGCNLQDRRLDAYEMKIRRTILENVAMMATGVALASTGLIRTLSLFLMALPIAGWIATALAWVGAGVLASMIAKLLTSTTVAEYIADYMLASMIGPATLKVISFPQCPNESLQEDWEARINEDIKVYMEQKQIQKQQAAKGAADAIKDVFKNDPELMKVLKVTKKKVDSGEVEKISKGGKAAVAQVK